MPSGPEPKPFLTPLSEEDVLDAMKSMESYLDITPGDFREIYQVAYRHAVERLNRSIKARDIMTRTVISVSVDAPLEKVAETMSGHRVSGVPVTGILDLMDAGSPIRIPVGVEAETFVPMAKQLTDEAFEAKVKEIFGL